MNSARRQRHLPSHSSPWAMVLLALLLAFHFSSHAAEAVLPPLTTVSGNPRLPGKFIWADLVTDDVSAARNFYSRLFGWQFLNSGGYFIGMNDSHPICGIFQKSRPPNDPKAKPRWFGYISVQNVPKVEKAVLKAGGKSLAARQNFPDRGEQAVFSDPEGAVFGVMRSTKGDPEDTLAGIGDWVWIQLLSRDAPKATEFYRKVAGYDVVENPQPNRINDYVLVSKGYARATVRTLAAQRNDVNPAWLPYVRVDNVAETANKARQLGGRVLVEPRPDLLEGKVAVIADPTGAAIGILAWVPEVAKGAK